MNIRSIIYPHVVFLYGILVAVYEYFIPFLLSHFYCIMDPTSSPIFVFCALATSSASFLFVLSPFSHGS